MRNMIKEGKMSLEHVRQILELLDIENSMKVSLMVLSNACTNKLFFLSFALRISHHGLFSSTNF